MTDSHYYEDDCNNIRKNSWGKWGQQLYESVENFFTEAGSDDNPYYLYSVKLSKKLLTDLNLFPIWGNTLSDQYEFGAIPASSATVEGEMNKIKLRFKKTFGQTARVDEYVDSSLNYSYGRSLIDNADLRQNEETKNNDDTDLDCYVCDSNLKKYNEAICSTCMNKVHKKECGERVNKLFICNICLKNSFNKNICSQAETENWRGMGFEKNVTKRSTNEDDYQVNNTLQHELESIQREEVLEKFL